ncbi:MAG: helix-turn-helix domain-containing protein, partial [Planctomycetota bacterium]
MPLSSLSVLVLDLSTARKKDGELMNYVQEKGFQLKTMRDPRRAEEAIRKGKVQIVFLILARRRSNHTTQVLRRLHKANSDVATIVITPKPSVEEATAAVRGRAFDYLSTPCDWADLEDSVQSAVEEKGFFLSQEDRLRHSLGTRLREARAERGLTLQQVANRSGLSVSLISQIELAKSSPSVASL